jgi:hypothetical protein
MLLLLVRICTHYSLEPISVATSSRGEMFVMLWYVLSKAVQRLPCLRRIRALGRPKAPSIVQRSLDNPDDEANACDVRDATNRTFTWALASYKAFIEYYAETHGET